MKDDIQEELRRYLPGRDRARELADTGAADERIARALDNAAGGVANENAASPGSATPVHDLLIAPPAVSAAAPPRAKAPSPPGAKEASPPEASKVDATPPPASRPRGLEATAVSPRLKPTRRKARWTTPLVSGLAALAVIVPVVLSLVLVKNNGPRDGDGALSSAPSAPAPLASSAGTLASAAPSSAPQATTSEPPIDTTAPPIDTTAPPVDTTARPATTTPDPAGVPAATGAPSPTGTSGAPSVPASTAGAAAPKPPAKTPGAADRKAPAVPSTSPTTASPPVPPAPTEPAGAAPRYTDPDF